MLEPLCCGRNYRSDTVFDAAVAIRTGTRHNINIYIDSDIDSDIDRNPSWISSSGNGKLVLFWSTKTPTTIIVRIPTKKGAIAVAVLSKQKLIWQQQQQ